MDYRADQRPVYASINRLLASGGRCGGTLRQLRHRQAESHASLFDQVHEAFMEGRRSSKRSSAPTTAIAAVRRSTSTPMPAGSMHGTSSIGCLRSRIDGRRGRRKPSDRGFRRNARPEFPQSVVNVTQRSVRQAKHTPRNPGPGGTLLYRPCLCPPNGITQPHY